MRAKDKPRIGTLDPDQRFAYAAKRLRYTLTVAVVVVVVMTVPPIVIMMVAVIFAIPMALVHLPALLVMVVVRMAPVSAGIGRAIPAARNPDVASILRAPVTVDPGITVAGHGWADFIPQGWRGSTDIDTDLSKGRGRERYCRDGSDDPFLHCHSPFFEYPLIRASLASMSGFVMRFTYDTLQEWEPKVSQMTSVSES